MKNKIKAPSSAISKAPSSLFQKNSFLTASYLSRTKIESQLISDKTSLSGKVYIFENDEDPEILKLLKKEALSWQKETWDRNPQVKPGGLIHLIGKNGPLWIIARRKLKGPFSHQGLLEDSDYGWYRDQMGPILGLARSYQLKKIFLYFEGSTENQELGVLLACELYSYNYKTAMQGKIIQDLPELILNKKEIKKSNSEADKEKKSQKHSFRLILKEAERRGRALNLARHVINMPANILNTETYSESISELFKEFPNVKVEIWDTKRLKEENMNLLLAVGAGAAHPPCLVHISYRPAPSTKENSKKTKAWAFVGKGVVFDTGGLDLKPSASMLLMKKDMAGSAHVLGLAWWVAMSQFSQSMDFYLPLAENSVSSKSMRPGDVYKSRSGLDIEIQNTDAEGRLVLADALDLAASQKGDNEPEFILDLATLTGACRVALGYDIAGLFSNDDSLSQEINQAGQRAADLNWRLPMFNRYFGKLSSSVSDFMNSGDGMGGAITASLFLEKFVKNKSWAHLDMYAWTDKATGPYSCSGANGQGLQCLMDFVSHRLKF